MVRTNAFPSTEIGTGQAIVLPTLRPLSGQRSPFVNSLTARTMNGSSNTDQFLIPDPFLPLLIPIRKAMKASKDSTWQLFHRLMYASPLVVALYQTLGARRLLLEEPTTGQAVILRVSLFLTQVLRFFLPTSVLLADLLKQIKAPSRLAFPT